MMGLSTLASDLKNTRYHDILQHSIILFSVKAKPRIPRPGLRNAFKSLIQLHTKTETCDPVVSGSPRNVRLSHPCELSQSVLSLRSE